MDHIRSQSTLSSSAVEASNSWNDFGALHKFFRGSKYAVHSSPAATSLPSAALQPAWETECGLLFRCCTRGGFGLQFSRLASKHVKLLLWCGCKLKDHIFDLSDLLARIGREYISRRKARAQTRRTPLCTEQRMGTWMSSISLVKLHHTDIRMTAWVCQHVFELVE